MTTFLLVDDALTSAEMRHEVGEPIMDDLIFIEHQGRRIVVGSVLEESTFAHREDVVDEFWNVHALGAEELLKDDSFPDGFLMAELTLRALQRVGSTTVTVPSGFRLLEADYLRDKGVNVRVDQDAWALRRRTKAPWELEGAERAQRAADLAMLIAARMLRDAEPTNDGRLRFEGEILTAEWIRETMSAELLGQGAESEEIIVHSGDACLSGHELGSGPILPDQSVIIDCFPRDRRTGVFTDMTRTFVAGRPSGELEKLHAHCKIALEIAYETIKPGVKDAHAKVVEYFHSQGFPTFDHHTGDEPLVEGFWHSLGHGVGLQVHERPRVGRRSDELKVGDVIAIEPGLYFRGIGGVRLEDTVIVTDSGISHITNPPFPYDLEP
jgi:Xaa-Pro aminopeptidase